MFVICIFGTVFSWIQAPIQAWLRPALWFPGLRSIHQKKERWILPGEPSFYFFKLKEGLATLQMTLYEIQNCRRMKISKAHSFSSGCFPICFPIISIIVNMVLFFIPFYDWGQNKERLSMIRQASGIQVEIEPLSNC